MRRLKGAYFTERCKHPPGDGRRCVATLAVSVPDPTLKTRAMRSRAQHKEAEALIPVTSKQSSRLCRASADRQLRAGLERAARGGARLGQRGGARRCRRPSPRSAHRGTWEQSGDGGVQPPRRFVRDQLGADSSRGGRVGGPAFHFRWSPRSLSGPQGPRERDGGRGLGAGSGRGGGAAAAGLSEPLPGRRVSPPRPGSPRFARPGPCPLPPRGTADPAAARGLTPSPAPFLGAAGSPRTEPGSRPLPAARSRSVPPARRPGCRPRGGRGCWAGAGMTGRAAPLSLLHYCHSRSEQCNNERASVRRAAARAGDSVRGRDVPPPPEGHPNGEGGGGGGGRLRLCNFLCLNAPLRRACAQRQRKVSDSRAAGLSAAARGQDEPLLYPADTE